MKKTILAVSTLAVASAVACGDRPTAYNDDVLATESFALTDRVAVIDQGADRVMLLQPLAGQGLNRSFVPIGKTLLKAQVSTDKKSLFVLSAGDVPRRKNNNQPPSLSVISSGGSKSYALESVHSNLTVDPDGRYVALFTSQTPAQTGRTPTTSGDDDDSTINPNANSLTDFVENPNEIVLVDLQASDPSQVITPRTLRSFGGVPQRVTFTDPLNLPGGQRRLLVVETDKDVHLIDLDALHATPVHTEITIPLTSGTSTAASVPAGVTIDDGDPKANDDPRIGLRVAGSSSVYTFTLVGATPGPADITGEVTNDFRPEVNLTDVGGVPGDIVFVRTDAGLRLAAVVPTANAVVLFDPTTSITSKVDAGGAFSKISLITNVVSSGGSDTALLYGGTAGVAFLSLGKAVGQTYRTVDVVSLGAAIGTISDVPPPRPELKVLNGAANGFYVLNLTSRTAAPLTTEGQATLHIAADGQRIWAFQHGASELAEVGLDNLHPIPLTLDRPIDAVYDVARADGGRSLVALDLRGAGGATVLDALHPDTTQSRSYYALFLEGLQ